MASTCSHQDETRKGVSSTAHLVASLRGLERKVYGENALFDDPYADVLGGEIGEKVMNSFDAKTKALGLIDGIAVRTKKLDDEVVKGYQIDNFQQICVLGAGLDSRPWRLKNEANLPISYFEVDFAEVFDFKIHALVEVNAVANFRYVSVAADLSLSSWSTTLESAGFDRSIPTLWLLEGFISYLTEAEADALLEMITTRLSSPGSRMIFTCITPITAIKISMHRFFPVDPLMWINKHGWSGEQVEIEVLGVQLNRPIRDQSMQGYYVVVVDYNPAIA